MLNIISNLRTYLRLRDEKKVAAQPPVEIFGVLAKNIPFVYGTVKNYSVLHNQDGSLVITLLLAPGVEDMDAPGYIYRPELDYAFTD